MLIGSPFSAKMDEWIHKGAELAWLIDPERKTVEIYRPNRASEIPSHILRIEGEGPIEGLILDLLPVWEPLKENLA